MSKKFIEFQEAGDMLRIHNKKNGSLLGEIFYLPKWRQFVFAPVARPIFSDDCLEEIVSTLKELNFVHKKKEKG